MCGICGFINRTGNREENRALLSRMNEKILHRGPDEQGEYLDDHVSLAMRRLSIIDLKTGNQPVSNEDSSVWTVFNGEIYNYRALREELKAKGHIFKSQGDTETIVHLYEEFGESFPEKLEGMFALALYDRKNKSLYFARDRMGEKPFYYSLVSGKLIFASEIKALLVHPGVEKKVNYDAIDSFLRYKYFPGHETVFEGIFQLPRASVMRCKQGEDPEIKKYWDITGRHSAVSCDSFEDSKEQVRNLLLKAVEKRMVSDVPIGAFLSGGIDSSVMVGLMSRLSDRNVNTYSMGFKQESFNELKQASIVARRFGTDHNEFIVDPGDVMELLWKILDAYDIPCGDSGSIPNLLLCENTSRHVKVSLSGIGGDETFCGYERYWVERLSRQYEKVPGFIRNGVIAPVLRKLPVSGHRKSYLMRAKKFLDACEKPVNERYAEIVSVFNRPMKGMLYSDKMQTKTRNSRALSVLLNELDSMRNADFIQKALYADMNTILVDDYLLLVDRVSMANSLEVRSPFLDHHLLEYTSQLPSEYKIRGYRTKHILREAYRDMLPPEILNLTKQGFEAPMSSWINKELKHEIRGMILGDQARKRDLFNFQYIEKLLEDHGKKTNNYQKQIFCLLTLEMWFRKYMD